MTQSNITNCIGTYNSIEYLKICIKSIRKNEFFKSPLIVFADENLDEYAAIWSETNPDWKLEIERILIRE